MGDQLDFDPTGGDPASQATLAGSAPASDTPAVTALLRIAATVLVVAVAVLAGVRLGTVPDASGPALPDEVAAIRDEGFAFAPNASAGDRQAFTAAIAAARPEAQRLIALVDGAVTVGFGAAGPGAAGVTQKIGDRYEIVMDLESVTQRLGRRAVSRVVLHELAHVIDFALVPDTLKAALDAAIPAGYPCPAGQPTGSCAATWERFAESFAKWAANDIGVDVQIGYLVPPPSGSLSQWGAPLAALADGLSPR